MTKLWLFLYAYSREWKAKWQTLTAQFQSLLPSRKDRHLSLRNVCLLAVLMA